jgi:hypothetical protein
MTLSAVSIVASSSMVADSWVSGWEMGGISTYELTNKKGDTLKIYCAENYTSINLNKANSDFLTLINKDNMKFVGPSRLDPTSSVLTDELALDNFLYEVSNNTKFTITMGKQKAEFNVTKNNVNEEILKECDMDKLNAMYDELNGDGGVPVQQQQQEQYVDKPLYKLNPSVYYSNLLYQNILLMEVASLVDGLIIYDVIINNETNGCISLEKPHNVKKVEYKTLKKFEKVSFRYPNNKCEIMQIEVFTNMGDFTHTLY